MTARVADNNGWFEVKANPLSKAGVFAYKGSSLAGAIDAITGLPAPAPNPDQMYNVYRPASTLADVDTINSFRLVPFVNDHTMLGDPRKLPVSKSHYVPTETKGAHGTTGDQIWFNPDDETLYGNIKVWSADVADLLDAGKNNLSLGYHCIYIYKPGVAPDGSAYDYVQERMRGNHVALVKAGRCGEEVSVMDSLSIAFDEKDLIPMAESLKKRNLKAHTAIVKSLVGGYVKKAIAKHPALKAKLGAASYAMDADDDEAVASEPGLSDVAEILGDILPALAEINGTIADSMAPPDDGMEDEMEAEMDAEGKPAMDAAGKPKMKPVMDAATGKPKRVAKKVAAVAPAAMDSVAMDAAVKTAVAAAVKPLQARIDAMTTKGVLGEIAKRDALAKQLSSFVGAFDHSEMTLSEVAKYGIEKLEVPAMDGQEIPAITAYLHGRKPAMPTHRAAGGSAAMDGAIDGKDSVTAFLKGGKKAA